MPLESRTLHVTRRNMLSLLLAGAARATVPPHTRPLNFVFILADDLGWADLTPYGADLHRTPNIERLCKQGVRFTTAYAAGSVCSPTRASIMTGKYPARVGMTIWREAAQNPPRNRKLIPPPVRADMPLEEVTVAEVLRDAGYHTAAVGKWHLGSAEYYPETQGFDINIGGTIWGAPQTHFYPYRGIVRVGREYRYVPHLENGQPGEYLGDRLTTEGLKIIEKSKDQPFFLYLAHHSVHTPIEAPGSLVEEYGRRLKPDMHHQNATYAAMVENLDANVGRVMDALERNGIAGRTVLIFTSDNGGYINQWGGARVTDNYPLRSGKGALYEGGVRVPLIVRWPGMTPAGAICEEPVVSTDFYPTMLQAAGLKGDAKHNANLDGISLAPLLRDPQGRLNRDELFFHYPHYYATTSPVSAVRARDWKLLEYYEDNHVELYNLKQDPREATDLAAQMPDKAAQLRRRLHDWLASVNAPMPRPNPEFKASR